MLRHTKNYKNPIQSRQPPQKSNIFKRILCLIKKNCYFNFEKVFLITFSKGNGRAKVEENNSNDTLVCDDDAHKVVLCALQSLFLKGWVLRFKKMILKIHLMVKAKTTQVWETSLRKNTGSSTNGEIHILSTNSNLRLKNLKFWAQNTNSCS